MDHQLGQAAGLKKHLFLSNSSLRSPQEWRPRPRVRARLLRPLLLPEGRRRRRKGVEEAKVPEVVGRYAWDCCYLFMLVLPRISPKKYDLFLKKGTMPL